MRSPRLNVVKNSAIPGNGASRPPNTSPVPVRAIELELIDPSTTQPRQHFHEDALLQLAASIRLHGVIQPIVVRPRGTRFELIAGERRVRASRLAGLTTIPAQVRDIDDAAARQVQIIENLQREGIHPLEEADAYQALLDSDKAITVDILATMVGMSKKYVYQCLTYRRLIPVVRETFAKGILTAGHAARIAQIPESLQTEALSACFFPVLGSRSTTVEELDASALAPLKDLDAFIQKKVKLNAHGEDAQVLLPELAAKVAEVEAAEHGTVIPLSTLHFHTDRADPKPILSQSWRDASGRNKCAHAQAGVIVLGEGRGTFIQVCIAKKKCSKHWAPKKASTAESREQRETQQKAAEERNREYCRQEEERQFNRQTLCPAVLKAIAQKTQSLKMGRHAVLPLLRGLPCNESLVKLVGALDKIPPARLPQALALAAALLQSWDLKQLTPVARHFGVDVKGIRSKLTAELAQAKSDDEQQALARRKSA
jgi:ParB/RepB/Spo0J family partition protein